MTDAQRTLLVTGWPGFIGRRLVDRLLEEDPTARVVALTERRFADTPAPDRVEVLGGDISERRLGLADADYERLVAEVTEVFHLAAVYDLAVPLDVAQKVNVEGTGNVVDFTVACERLERHHYVSTAYVAGTRHGVVYEHELSEGQGFKNHYESTKYQAEVWVRGAQDVVPTTIYRPAIVVGDSKTGETAKFDGPYYILRSISKLGQLKLPMPNLGRSEAAFNVVPVDFVVDALLAGVQSQKAIGRTLHLVDPDPITAKELVALLSREYAGKDPKGFAPPASFELALRSKRMRQFFAGTPRESIRYLNHSVRFDTRQATDVLAEAGKRCPRIEEYVKPVVAYFKAHEHDA